MTLALVTVFWVLIPPTYRTNDDPNIRRQIEGFAAPNAVPSGYLLVAPSLVGWPLVAAQRAVSAHVWDFVVSGLLLWSVAMMLTIAWAASVSIASRSITIGATLLTIIPLLPALQFTISATLAGVASMLAIAMELRGPAPRTSVIAASFALACAGLLIRPFGATAGGLIALMLMMPVAITDRERRSDRVLALGVAACALLACAAGVLVLDRALYGLSPAWQAYRDDQVTASLFDRGAYMPSDVVAAIQAQLGWSANDWELLRRYWGVDPVIHSHERIQTLYRTWSALVGPRLEARWYLERAIDELRITNIARLLANSRTALAGCALIVAAAASRRGVAISMAMTALFVTACAAVEIVFKEMPFRLFGPLQVCLVVATAIVIGRLRRASRPVWAVTGAVIALSLVAVEARGMIRNAIADVRQSSEVEAQVTELLQQHPSLLVLHADSFPSEHWWRPFHSPAAQLPAIQLGVNNNNPSVQDYVARTYHDSLLHAICTDPSILVIAERGRLGPVTSYMAEHYGTEATWTEAYSGSFRAWRCTANAPPEPTTTALRTR